MALLEQASMYIHLDPRAETVQVPAWFKKQPQLVLQVGLNMAVPIPDLHVDEQGLSCTLSFNRAPFFCMIPWPAVFALVGEKGQAMVWAEDVPAEVAAQAQAQKAPEKARSHLRSVGEGETTDKVEKAAPTPSTEHKPAAKVSKAAKPSTMQPAKRAVKVAAKGRPTGKAVAKAAPQKASAKTPAEKLRASKKAPVAVPPAAKPEAATPRAAPVPVPAKKAVQPKPEAARASAESSKPKRELPPYLRVVK